MGRAPYECADSDDVRMLLGGPDSRYVWGHAGACMHVLVHGQSSVLGVRTLR
jgi:hypothetical protein